MDVTREVSKTVISLANSQLIGKLRSNLQSTEVPPPPQLIPPSILLTPASPNQGDLAALPPLPSFHLVLQDQGDPKDPPSPPSSMPASLQDQGVQPWLPLMIPPFLQDQGWRQNSGLSFANQEGPPVLVSSWWKTVALDCLSKDLSPNNKLTGRTLFIPILTTRAEEIWGVDRSPYHPKSRSNYRLQVHFYRILRFLIRRY